MRRIATALAAFALLTGTAFAQGNNKADDKPGGGKSAATEQGRGQGQGRGNNANRGGGEIAPAAASDRGSARGENARVSGQGNAMREERGNSAQSQRGAGNANRADRAVQRGADDRGRGNDSRAVVADRGGGVAVANRLDRGPDFSFIREGTRGLITGCPPGLARKNPPCVPPGQVRGLMRHFAFDRPEWWGLRWLDDGRYFYDDGYLVRLGPDGRIGGYVPLLGGALSIGNPWPAHYAPVPVPDYYAEYYGLGPYDSYRYADNVIYRVDPETDAITSIAALLTGDQFAVGQPLPLGYDVYNVPYGYRDQYYDTPDAHYRYSDGYIYEVDPETQLIAAIIELLV